MATHFTDSYNRTIRTLRISVTDQCNLRCTYCFTEEPTFIPQSHILSYDDIRHIFHFCDSYHIHKIRITGGEPLVRPNIIPFLSSIKKELPHLDIRITTNGVLLEQHLDDLYNMGIRHLNISLDSFDAKIFKQITRRDTFQKVYNAICKSIDYGFIVKINAVAMRGYTDFEIEQFIDFAYNNPVSVRFIEYMPIGSTVSLAPSIFWSAQDILACIKQYVQLEPIYTPFSSSPAREYHIIGGKGSIGIISPLSQNFCDTCDRLRITADGFIRTCLYDTQQISIKEALRSVNPQKALAQCISSAVKHKPKGIELFHDRNGSVLSRRSMNAIGG